MSHTVEEKLWFPFVPPSSSLRIIYVTLEMNTSNLYCARAVVWNVGCETQRHKRMNVCMYVCTWVKSGPNHKGIDNEIIFQQVVSHSVWHIVSNVHCVMTTLGEWSSIVLQPAFIILFVLGHCLRWLWPPIRGSSHPALPHALISSSVRYMRGSSLKLKIFQKKLGSANQLMILERKSNGTYFSPKKKMMENINGNRWSKCEK